MVGVFDVAEYVLSEVGYVSTMKLQKLVFYSQAYSLVALDEPLFSDDFEAWVNGPVCPPCFGLTRVCLSSVKEICELRAIWARLQRSRRRAWSMSCLRWVNLAGKN